MFATTITVEKCQLSAAECNELFAPVRRVPRFVSGGLWNDLERVSRAEVQRKVKQSLADFYSFNHRLRNARVDFRGCVEWCGQPKLLAIVLTRHLNPIGLD
jgi:hypothetical protein